MVLGRNNRIVLTLKLITVDFSYPPHIAAGCWRSQRCPHHFPASNILDFPPQILLDSLGFVARYSLIRYWYVHTFVCVSMASGISVINHYRSRAHPQLPPFHASDKHPRNNKNPTNKTSINNNQMK